MTTNLGSYLGRKDRAHVQVFSRAGVLGRERSTRRCEAIAAATGCPCRRLSMVGSKLCPSHAPLTEFVRLDALNRPRLERVAKGGNPSNALKASRSLAALDRRAQFYRWRLDPNSPGETVKFANPHDRERCEAWLRRNGLAIDEVSEISGEMPTALCVDRSLWAALRFVVKGNIPETRAIHSARWAHVMDGRFYKRLRKKLAECVDVSAD